MWTMSWLLISKIEKQRLQVRVGYGFFQEWGSQHLKYENQTIDTFKDVHLHVGI
jgi:hypothetical protein